MTPEQQRIAIAEACGWKPASPDAKPYLRQWRHPNPRNANLYMLPDFLGDLNAMHEAEKTLNAIQLNCYENELAEMCNIRVASMAAAYRWHATAAQRAEALLRALGKWEGGAA